MVMVATVQSDAMTSAQEARAGCSWCCHLPCPPAITLHTSGFVAVLQSCNACGVAESLRHRPNRDADSAPPL